MRVRLHLLLLSLLSIATCIPIMSTDDVLPVTPDPPGGQGTGKDTNALVEFIDEADALDGGQDENCTCALTEGEGGLCDTTTSVCAPPSNVGFLATCPTGSTTVYMDADGNRTIASTNSLDWNATGAYEVTCEFLKTGKFSPTAPKVAKPCSPAELPLLTPCAHCDHSKLIYLPYGNGYWAMCTEGSLVTNNASNYGNVECNEDGEWEEGITMANCDVSDAPVQKCLSKMNGASGDVKFACGFNRCILSCKDASKKFDYMSSDPPTVFSSDGAPLQNSTTKTAKQSALLECDDGDLYDPADAWVIDSSDVATIKCV